MFNLLEYIANENDRIQSMPFHDKLDEAFRDGAIAALEQLHKRIEYQLRNDGSCIVIIQSITEEQNKAIHQILNGGN